VQLAALLRISTTSFATFKKAARTRRTSRVKRALRANFLLIGASTIAAGYLRSIEREPATERVACQVMQRRKACRCRQAPIHSQGDRRCQCQRMRNNVVREFHRCNPRLDSTTDIHDPFSYWCRLVVCGEPPADGRTAGSQAILNLAATPRKRTPLQWFVSDGCSAPPLPPLSTGQAVTPAVGTAAPVR
jgi:hypothetical protein